MDTAAKPDTRPKILCVDDEPNVLAGLALNLHRRYGVMIASGGIEALRVLQEDGEIAVVISDMRMPGMDGATFLSRARVLVPDAVRILLTGQSDMSAAVAAVNDGQVFRFLTKPCPPATLQAAVAAAVNQHELLTAERVLLEQTLHGCIKALTDILALASPVSFGRALRIKHYAGSLAAAVQLPDRWQVEVAAMFSQLGLITLPPATVERLRAGQDLSSEEQQMVDRLPAVTADLLAPIPRIDGVRRLLATVDRPFEQIAPGGDPADAARLKGAQLLRVAIDFDDLESRGGSAALALSTMRGREGRYDRALLDALEQTHVADTSRDEVRELPLAALRAGMVLADDVRLVSGPILVARGYEVTERFVERARNFAAGSIKQPVRVITRHADVLVAP